MTAATMATAESDESDSAIVFDIAAAERAAAEEQDSDRIPLRDWEQVEAVDGAPSPPRSTASAASCTLPPGKWWDCEPHGARASRTTSRHPVAAYPCRRSSRPAARTMFALLSVLTMLWILLGQSS